MTNKYNHYLSFGFNCEVGFALQQSSLLSPSLFTWADVRGTNALVNALNHFDDLFSGEVIKYSGNMFFCQKMKIGFHGKLKFEDAKKMDGSFDEKLIEESLAELKSRLLYLSIRQNEIFAEGNVLVVCKHMSDIFVEAYSLSESSIAISKAIKSKYNVSKFDLLFISEGAKELPLDVDGIYYRSISNFSPRSNASQIATDSWRLTLSEFI
jgi:hypothetical protein